MNIVCIDVKQPDGEIVSLPTMYQSSRIDKAKLQADYVASFLPKSVSVSVRHHRTGECFYTTEGKL